MSTGNPYTSAQAPAYNLIAPDIGAEQAKLARQQQMADILRQQSLEPMGNTEMVSGWAVKKSPWESVTKLAQALGANYAQKGVDEKQVGLAKAMQERQMAAFDSMAGGGAQPGAAPPQAAPAAQQPVDMSMDPMQVTEGAMAHPTPQAAPQAAPAQAPAAPQNPKMESLRNQARAAYMLGNKELSNKIIENMSLMTEGQRTDNYLGITADQSRQSELAKRFKEGTMSLQPGQTNVMPDGSRMVAPNFETGVAGGFDARGNPIASEIQGSANIAANRAGAVTDATARANAGQRMTTVQIGGRPVMMTEAQAVQMSNGGAAPTGTQFNNPNPGGMSLDFKGDTQAVFDKISQIKDPAVRAQAMQALQQMPAQVPSGVGIAGSTAAENELEVGQVKNNLAIQKSRIENAQSPEQQQKLLDAKGVLSLLDAADPLLASGVPTASTGGVIRDQLTGAMGISTEASKAASQLASIGGALVSKMPKMSGPQSDKDVAQYKEMAGRLGDPSVPIGDRQAAAQVIRKLNEKYLSDNQASIASNALTANTGMPAPRQLPPAAPAAKTTFDAIPPASQFAGKRMRAPDGSIMRSDGKNWVKE